MTDNGPIWICVNKIDKRITFKMKTGYYLELLIPETMKLLGSTKIKITENESSRDLPNLEMAEVVLIHFNIVHNDYKFNSILL